MKLKNVLFVLVILLAAFEVFAQETKIKTIQGMPYVGSQIIKADRGFKFIHPDSSVTPGDVKNLVSSEYNVTGNIAYVSTDGNDGTAVIGNPLKPFAGILSAIDAVQATSDTTNVTIYIYSGDYTIDLSNSWVNLTPFDTTTYIHESGVITLDGEDQTHEGFTDYTDVNENAVEQKVVNIHFPNTDLIKTNVDGGLSPNWFFAYTHSGSKFSANVKSIKADLSISKSFCSKIALDKFYLDVVNLVLNGGRAFIYEGSTDGGNLSGGVISVNIENAIVQDGQSGLFWLGLPGVTKDSLTITASVGTYKVYDAIINFSAGGILSFDSLSNSVVNYRFGSVLFENAVSSGAFLDFNLAEGFNNSIKAEIGASNFGGFQREIVTLRGQFTNDVVDINFGNIKVEEIDNLVAHAVSGGSAVDLTQSSIKLNFGDIQIGTHNQAGIEHSAINTLDSSIYSIKGGTVTIDDGAAVPFFNLQTTLQNHSQYTIDFESITSPTNAAMFDLTDITADTLENSQLILRGKYTNTVGSGVLLDASSTHAVWFDNFVLNIPSGEDFSSTVATSILTTNVFTNGTNDADVTELIEAVIRTADVDYIR